MVTYLNIALIIISVLLILSVILQSKGAGLGGLSGADTGSVYTARRGVERTLFRLTIILSVIFFALVLTLVFLPAMYAIWFRIVPRSKDEEEARASTTKEVYPCTT